MLPFASGRDRERLRSSVDVSISTTATADNPYPGIQIWDIEIAAFGLSGAGQDDEDERPVVIGHGEALTVDIDSPTFVSALHAYDSSSSRIADRVCDRKLAGLTDAALEQLAYEGDGVVFTRVELRPEWRGYDLGLCAVALALSTLGRGCSWSALQAAGLGAEGARAVGAHRALSTHWARLGFEPFADDVMLLDRVEGGFEDALKGLGLR